MTTPATLEQEGSTLVLVDQPWARVKNAVPIPATADLQAELLQLDPAAFAALLRCHLVPRDNQPDARQRWSNLWAAIDADADLTEQTFDVLEEFLDACEAAASDDTLTDQQRRRAVKFGRFCDDAWQRLQNVPDAAEPLAWAGRAARGFNTPARRVLATLVDAIDRHRQTIQEEGEARPADDQLWAVLRAVSLDPARSRR